MINRKLLAAAMLLPAGWAGSVHAQTITFIDESGEIGPGDRRDNEGNYFDEYSFTATQGERLRVSANRLANVDPVVIIYGPNGGEVARDDDSGGFPNARAEFTVPQSGAYRVVLRGYGRSTGRYRVIMENLTPPSPVRQLLGDQAGSFTNASLRLPGEDRHYQDYRVRLSAGQEILINLDSSAFDAYLWVYDAGNMTNALASNDDSNGSLNSAIYFTAPRTGDYIVRASQLSHADGNYRLRVRRLVPF